MPMIPTEVYEQIKRRLQHRYEFSRAEQKLEELRTKAYYPSSPRFDRQGGRSTAETDKMGSMVSQLVEAEDAAAIDQAWRVVFRRIDEAFPQGTPEGDTAWLLYHEHMTQAQVCQQMEIDRQTARRRTDTYICHAALLAAMYGLIKDGGDSDV